MANIEKIKNNICLFVGEIKGASDALKLLICDYDSEMTTEKMEATFFLIGEINHRISALDDFIAESGEMDWFSSYQNSLDIYKIYVDKVRESQIDKSSNRGNES